MFFMYRRIFLFVFFSSLTCGLTGHEIKIDSLINLLNTTPFDTNRVNIQLTLGSHMYRGSPQDALRYSLDAAELSRKLNYKKGLALAYKNAGLSHYVNGEYAETINFWQLALEAFRSYNDKAGIANITSNMGAVYNNFGEDTKALELYFEARKAAEEIGDSLRIVTTMINIGNIYLKKSVTYDKAIEFFSTALPIARGLKDLEAIGTTAVNLGEAFYKKGDFASALIYYHESLNAFESNSSDNLCYTLTNMGRVYAAQRDFEQALMRQNKALSIATSLHAKPVILSALIGLGDTYKLKEDFSLATETYRKAEDLAKEISANFELRDIYSGLSQINATLTDYMNAYKYQVLLTEIKEKLYLSSNDNLIKQQQLSFDLVKKEDEVKIQKLAVQKQRIVKNAFLAGLVFIMVIAFIIFRNYLNKVKINRLLDRQKAQIETLLLNILPRKVAEELQQSGQATPRNYENVSVLFTDFKGFTMIAESLSPQELIAELNQVFYVIDGIIEKYNLEKIKTIGDSYMCAGGIPVEDDLHPVNIVKAALEIRDHILQENIRRNAMNKFSWDVRIGIHTGPLVAGVVGKKKYAYDIWGSTVNIASRMESSGEPGKVNISASTYNLIRDRFNCQYRGRVSAKNIGEIDMYFVENEINTAI